MKRAWLGGAAIVATLILQAASLATIADWPHRLPAHLVCYVAAGIAWLAAIGTLRTLARARVLVLIATLLLRIWGLALPPVHSDDVHRYLWDGQVQRAGIDPYRYAPDDPALSALRGPTYAHVNNRQLPTIYPPFAQLVFHAAAALPLSPLTSWKLVVGSADLATAAMLGMVSPTAALIWLTCPLSLIELAVNAHVDALGIALLCGALVAIGRRRRSLGGVLLALATAVKLLPVYLLLLLRDRRLSLAAITTLLVVIAPFIGAGARLSGSLGEYGRRWRANEGAFAVLQDGARGLVWIAGKRAPTDETRLGTFTRLVTGRDRDEAYPDELAAALARGTTLALFVIILVAAERHARRRSMSLPERALYYGEVGIGAFLLLSPSLHPWYALWAMPVVVLRPSPFSPAWLWLVAVAPLGHAPLVGYLEGRPWHDPIWTRLVEYVPAWLICGRAAWRQLSSARDVV